MEDLDPPREVPGVADDILRTLEIHGLTWDGPVLYQSSRLDAYQAALERLIDAGLAYPCCCSRKQVMESGKRGELGMIYNGRCRHDPRPCAGRNPAWRVITHDEPTAFDDLRRGHYAQRLASELGDFVIKRADGFFAYQLAVVVDDAWQSISEVVRGEDLLDNTPRQIHLQQLLGLATPDYLHLPLVTNEQGQKLSKQTFAQPLDPNRRGNNLLTALHHLGIALPASLAKAAVEEILNAALERVRQPSWDWRSIHPRPQQSTSA